MSIKGISVDWYCDECGAYLNSQSGFTTSSGSWTCTECGYDNDVTDGNIYYDSDTIDQMTPEEIEEVYDAYEDYDRRHPEDAEYFRELQELGDEYEEENEE